MLFYTAESVIQNCKYVEEITDKSILLPHDEYISFTQTTSADLAEYVVQT